MEELSFALHRRTKFEDDEAEKKAWEALDQTLLRWKATRFSAKDFESVSPIVFEDLPALEAKLEALRPKNQGGHDSSSANKMYREGASDGAARGQFENSRCAYAVLHPSSISPSNMPRIVCYISFSKTYTASLEASATSATPRGAPPSAFSASAITSGRLIKDGAKIRA